MAAPTMQAACRGGHGGNEVVCVGTCPLPQRRPGKVLVRLRAAGRAAWRPVIDRDYALDGVTAALARLEAGEQVGKLADPHRLTRVGVAGTVAAGPPRSRYRPTNAKSISGSRPLTMRAMLLPEPQACVQPSVPCPVLR